MKWEKETFYVQRHERTGEILRLEEEPPKEYLLEVMKRMREARKAVKQRINKREMGD